MWKINPGITPAAAIKINDILLFFQRHTRELVCIDEIQRKPDLFIPLRSILRKGQVILLGYASGDLLRQSSETLAGRILYIELTPFLISEVCTGKVDEPYEITGGVKVASPLDFIRHYKQSSHS